MYQPLHQVDPLLYQEPQGLEPDVLPVRFVPNSASALKIDELLSSPPKATPALRELLRDYSTLKGSLSLR